MYYIVNKSSGEILFSTSDKDLANNRKEEIGDQVSLLELDEVLNHMEQEINLSDGSVVPKSLSEEEQKLINREKRDVKFKGTIDKMNEVWYNSLSSDQQTRLATWRQEWLDYPQTNTEPTTDVTDIFSN